MNIYFQSGEFYGINNEWASILVQILGFLVTIFAAYYGAKKSVEHQTSQSNKMLEKETKARYDYFKEPSNWPYNTIKTQIRFFFQYCYRIKRNPSQLFDNGLVPLDQLATLIQLLGEEKTYTSFVKHHPNNNNANRAYNNLIGICDYYLVSCKTVANQIYESRERIFFLREEFIKTFKIFERRIINHCESKKYNNSIQSSQILDLFHSSQQNALIDLRKVRNTIVIPALRDSKALLSESDYNLIYENFLIQEELLFKIESRNIHDVKNIQSSIRIMTNTLCRLNELLKGL